MNVLLSQQIIILEFFLGIILALLIIGFFPLIFLPYLNSFFRDVLEKVSTAKYFAE